MRLTDWHKCRRWNDRKYNCPYLGEDDHGDDDDDDPKKDPNPPASEPRQYLDIPGFGDSTIPLLRRVRELKRPEVQEPLREPIPFPTPRPIPEPAPGVAATQSPTGDIKTWKQLYQWYLDHPQVPAPAIPSLPPPLAPAPGSLPEPVKVPATSTSLAAETADLSETALTKSLPIYVKPPNPWDIGVRKPALASAQATTSTTARKESGRQTRSNAGRIAAGAATAIVGAGAAYLVRRGGGGGTGRSAPFMLRPKGLALAR